MELRAEFDPPIAEVERSVDGRPASIASWPYRASWQLDRGAHRVQLRAGERLGAPVQFEVR